MPTLKMSIPHRLTEEEAIKRVNDLMDRLRANHPDQLSSVNVDWSGKTSSLQFVAKGFHIAGTIHVLPSSINIQAKVPLIVSLYQQKIKDLIEKEAEQLFS